jgi:hypothetical protein
MAGGGGSVASARARGKRPGRVYKGAGGRLRGRGVNHVAGARAAWAARRCDVRRGGRPMACGGWHAGKWELATWRRPNTRDRHPQWHSRHGAWTVGSAGASACARGVRMATSVIRVRDVARGCALAFPSENSSLRLSSNWFFSKFSN